MKKLILSLIIFSLTFLMYSQIPEQQLHYDWTGDGRFTKIRIYFSGGITTGGSFEGMGSGLDPQQLANPTRAATRASVCIITFIGEFFSHEPGSGELRQRGGHRRGGQHGWVSDQRHNGPRALLGGGGRGQPSRTGIF